MWFSVEQELKELKEINEKLVAIIKNTRLKMMNKNLKEKVSIMSPVICDAIKGIEKDLKPEDRLNYYLGKTLGRIEAIVSILSKAEEENDG